jgi:hypothetical protein
VEVRAERAQGTAGLVVDVLDDGLAKLCLGSRRGCEKSLHDLKPPGGRTLRPVASSPPPAGHGVVPTISVYTPYRDAHLTRPVSPRERQPYGEATGLDQPCRPRPADAVPGRGGDRERRMASATGRNRRNCSRQRYPRLEMQVANSFFGSQLDDRHKKADNGCRTAIGSKEKDGIDLDEDSGQLQRLFESRGPSKLMVLTYCGRTVGNGGPATTAAANRCAAPEPCPRSAQSNWRQATALLHPAGRARSPTGWVPA